MEIYAMIPNSETSGFCRAWILGHSPTEISDVLNISQLWDNVYTFMIFFFFNVLEAVKVRISGGNLWPTKTLPITYHYQDAHRNYDYEKPTSELIFFNDTDGMIIHFFLINTWAQVSSS